MPGSEPEEKRMCAAPTVTGTAGAPSRESLRCPKDPSLTPRFDVVRRSVSGLPKGRVSRRGQFLCDAG